MRKTRMFEEFVGRDVACVRSVATLRTIDESAAALVRLRVAELAEQPALIDRELERARALKLDLGEIAHARLGRSEHPQTAALLMVAGKMVRDHGRYLRLVAESARHVGISFAELQELARVVGDVLVDAWLEALAKGPGAASIGKPGRSSQ